MERTLLLVDDEENITSSLSRMLRRDGYRILRASSGQEGLKILAKNPVGVIVSDQRMPEMSGTEFLSRVRERHPETIRIVLSGYTDLNSVTEAINRGAIYKFLTKPWEDDQLRAHIEEAFQVYEMRMENIRLTQQLKVANNELGRINAALEIQGQEGAQQAMRNLHVTRLAQEILEHLPLAVVGIDNEGRIALANRRAQEWFGLVGSLIGEEAASCIPSDFLIYSTANIPGASRANPFALGDGRLGRYWHYTLGDVSNVCGTVLVAEMKQQDDYT